MTFVKLWSSSAQIRFKIDIPVLVEHLHYLCMFFYADYTLLSIYHYLIVTQHTDIKSSTEYRYIL